MPLVFCRTPHSRSSNHLRSSISVLATLVSCVLTSASAAVAQSASTQTAATPQIAIEPMTQVVVNPPSGYFSDPYPVHFAPYIGFFVPQTFSGTTKDLLTCEGKIRPECFTETPLTVDLDPIRPQAQAAGSTIVSTEAIHPYQDNYGRWQMALAIHVKNEALQATGTWSVILHAHPTVETLTAPTSWVADSILIGSFAKPVPANYDGKYFEDGGNLYLLYSKRLSKSAPAHDGVVAQLMESATQLAKQDPVTLLSPDDANGGFNSEYFFGLKSDNTFKLVETGNITKIQGKYALAYSTGDFEQADYKTGVAWSDTFLPEPNTTYKKALMEDTADVWGQPNHLEVVYLLQSQEPAWPNYVAAQVLAPGVPSIIREDNLGAFLGDEGGTYFLYFAGYAPGDAHPVPPHGYFSPDKRRPFFVKLQVSIPANATVSGTSNNDLVSWIRPVTQ